MKGLGDLLFVVSGCFGPQDKLMVAYLAPTCINQKENMDENKLVTMSYSGDGKNYIRGYYKMDTWT